MKKPPSSLPRFFISSYTGAEKRLTLDEDNSLHIIQVLRKKPGDQLSLTNGKGALLIAEIVIANKKATEVAILSEEITGAPARKITIGISLVKNAGRFEWFLEKATEIGVTSILPLICERTEKQHFRSDRMNNILVSAMLQSQQAWLPALSEPVGLLSYMKSFSQPLKLIAHCLPGDKNNISNLGKEHTDILIIIGPEGDFSQQEITLALEENFLPVSLGNTRLRTETAGMVAAALLAQT